MQKLTYTRCGDYYIPDICLDEENKPIGRWGRMHRDYIKEHRPALYSQLCLNGKLWTYLADLNEQAKNRLEVIIEQMKAAVSHEIKTPLAVMQNYATLLQNDSLSEMQRKEYSQVIFDATGQLSSLVTNILKLSKLENQSITQASKPYDVCEQLGECVLAFAERLEEKNIQFSVEMEDKAMVATDESLVEIIWNNLLSNAIKFTPDGGTIQLTQKSDASCLLISVQDTGCGMKPETMKHIFDKFYQGDTSYSGTGNGLGLALVKRVIDMIGGEISVTSEHGNGTIFTVKLRRAENETGKKNTV